MAWQNIPNNPNWQYDDNPPDPGGKQSALWAKQTTGIRTDGVNQYYTRVRRVPKDATDANANRGELSKTYWDNQA